MRIGLGRIGGAGGRPISVLGLYRPPVLKYAVAVVSAPDDHLAAGPHRRVIVSRSGRTGGGRGCPTVGAGIVAPAGVRSGCGRHPPQTIISLPVHTAV